MELLATQLAFFAQKTQCDSRESRNSENTEQRPERFVTSFRSENAEQRPDVDIPPITGDKKNKINADW